jgi:D-alanyl-D-alanine carboxypeptidase
MANSRKACIARRKFALGGTVSFLLGIVATLATPAHAAKPTTWIVIDASSGQVLNERDPDALNYPASLTKMMTLFLTFDALEHHRISLDQRFYVSEHAAIQRPSKLGLVPGSTIGVRDLILAVVTHSANDAAVVLAEGLGGTESAFAAKMNAEAQALGMTRTNFHNASGLPDPLQYTTARDLAKLGLALYRTFPKEYRYFATEEFDYNGAIYTNHNHLMEAFEGMDGIKTGFINASGFNLAASAVRNNRRLIGVIMGGRSAQSRDMDMAELLDDAFAHRVPSSPGNVAVASSDASDGGIIHDNIRASVSAISPDVAASTLNASADADFHRPVYRSTRAHHYRHFQHHHIRQTAHHKLRHGVVLASVEVSQGGFSRHHNDHHYAVHKHRPHVVANHQHATKPSLTESHRHDRGASSASVSRPVHRSHGVACGGWNGSNQPCPARFDTSAHGSLQSASASSGTRGSLG